MHARPHQHARHQQDYFTHVSEKYVDFTHDRLPVLNASGKYSTDLFANQSIAHIYHHMRRRKEVHGRVASAPVVEQCVIAHSYDRFVRTLVLATCMGVCCSSRHYCYTLR